MPGFASRQHLPNMRSDAPSCNRKEFRGMALHLQKGRACTRTPSQAMIKCKLTTSKTKLLGLSKEEMKVLVRNIGEQDFRATQLHKWVYEQRGRDIDNCTVLSKGLRKAMSEAEISVGRDTVVDVVTSDDGTTKILCALDDKRVIEAVGIPSFQARKPRLTVCVSSQAGCAMQCTFCATGRGGFFRNLKANEIVSQVMEIEDKFDGKRASNVVFMGMGEPMANLKEVIHSFKIMNSDLKIGARNITISTVGVPNTIQQLAEEKLQVTLAVSLHAPTQSLREKIIPTAKNYPLEILLEDCRQYFNTTGRRISFEYTLLDKVNDSSLHASQLAKAFKLAKITSPHVNLIPYNPVDGASYQRPSDVRVKNFKKALEEVGVTASVRSTRGLEVNAACGQLRNRFQSHPLPSNDWVSSVN